MAVQVLVQWLYDSGLATYLPTQHHPAERKAPPHSCHGMPRRMPMPMSMPMPMPHVPCPMTWAATEDGHLVSPTAWRQDSGEMQRANAPATASARRLRVLP
jgi:hypothetical protein